VSGLLFLSFQNIFGMIFFWLARIRAIVHDGSSAIGAASVTARLAISRLAPTRADPLRSRAGWLRSGWLHAAMPKGSRIPGAGRRWSAGESPTRCFRLDRRPVAERRPARLSANAAQEMERKFSCLQTLEKSQSRKIISGRGGHGDASRWKSAMTEARRRRSSRTALGQRGAENGGEIFLPANL